MSAYLLRPLLDCVQAYSYQMASTPPNKTPPKARYDAAHAWYIKAAPYVMKLTQPFIWICTTADLLNVLFQQANSHSSLSTAGDLASAALCPARGFSSSHAPMPEVRTTPIFFLGCMLVLFGAWLRMTCFRTLGNLFTFDLTIMPSHKLITCGPYRFVRHPSYSGSLIMNLGLALVNLTSGSWIAECGMLGRGWVGVAMRGLLFVAWYAWWLSVGVQRAQAEDAELGKYFGKEWEQYADQVGYWFVPGVL